MHPANFFDKTALAAAHILNDFDSFGFSKHLEKQVVGLFFEEEAARDFEGSVTCELTVNLIARLYPRIAICSDCEEGDEKVEHLKSLARSIYPQIEIAETLDNATAVIVVGNNKPKSSAPTFFLGSSGWLMYFSPEKPMGSGKSSNPFGAAASACIGAANVFRSIFKEQLGKECDDEFTLSLLNYGKNETAETGTLPSKVDLQSVHLVGAGAVGNACLWALEKGSGWVGNLSVIDPEPIELSNLQRYILTTQKSVEQKKTDMALNYFENSDINIIPFSHSWQSFTEETGIYSIDCVAVALDSARDRIAVQASLPKHIINSWTQPSNLGVSRHNFGDDNACLACLYMPDREMPSDVQKIATALNLPPDDEEVKNLLYTGNPVGPEFIKRVKVANPEISEQLDTFATEPLIRFYSDGVCGSLLIPHTNSDGRTGNVETPMAFQSAMAGIMLAAELIIEAGNLRETPLPTVTTINLLDSIGEELSHPHKQHPSGRCICHDDDFITVYDKKYSLLGKRVSPPDS